jgi:hypothetical protein
MTHVARLKKRVRDIILRFEFLIGDDRAIDAGKLPVCDYLHV